MKNIRKIIRGDPGFICRESHTVRYILPWKKAAYGNVISFLFFFYDRVRINWNHSMTDYGFHVFKKIKQTVFTFSQFIVFINSSN